MHHRAALVHQQPVAPVRARFDRLAFGLVLLDSVLHSLGQLGLDLRGRHRDAIDEEHQIQRFVALRLVMHLMHHPQDVRLVISLSVPDALVRRIRGRTHDRLIARHFESVANHFYRAVVPQGGNQLHAQVVLPVPAHGRTHLLQLLRRNSFLEFDEVRHVQRRLRVEPRIVRAHPPAVLTLQARDRTRQVPFERILPVQTVNHAQHAPPVQSIRPVTAWKIRLLRYSSSLAITCS